MALEISGKVKSISERLSGTSKSGNSWEKGGIVIETEEQYPKDIYCDTWGDIISKAEGFKAGDRVKINIDIQSREYNGKWFTNVKAWRIEQTDGGGGTTPETGGDNSTDNDNTPPPPEPPKTENSSSDDAEEGGDDDLPF